MSSKGYKHSEKTRKYLGSILIEAGKNTRFKKGQVSPNRGKHLKSPMEGKKHKPETLEKMRQARLKNPNRYWLGKKQPRFQGENNPNWKGGITPENDKIHKSNEYREWRRQVFFRDRFTCRVCLSKGYVQANHICPFRSHKELRHDINNGITLCIECHKFIFKREELFIKFFQGILENGLNSAEVSQEITPSQQERLRQALWACVEVKGE